MRLSLMMVFLLACSVARSQPRLPDHETTPTRQSVLESALVVWQWDMAGCYDILADRIDASTVSITVKYSLSKQIPKALREGGSENLWQKASKPLRTLILQASANRARTEAERMERQAAAVRVWATRMDDLATSVGKEK